MNWRRLYAILEICGTVSLFSFVGAGFWSFIVAGLCRTAFRLDDNKVMLLIGLPLFIVMTIWLIRVLPKHLRKGGMLSDELKKFGPWFKSDNR